MSCAESIPPCCVPDACTGVGDEVNECHAVSVSIDHTESHRDDTQADMSITTVAAGTGIDTDGEGCAANDPNTILLSWSNLTYRVPDKFQTQRTLLHDVSGYVASGHMLAILGPTGAGKTTLLDVLAHRKRIGSVEGDIRLNGRLVDTSALRRSSGYVQQEDMFYPFITVEETIRFAMELRTPPSVTAAEMEQRVADVVQLLGIAHVKGRQIGTASNSSSSTKGGISGGERKRCAIAQELATMPALLFLDEPTTGLDTFTALHLLALLKKLASAGMAVVFSIHQPRSAIFQLFDRIMLLTSTGEQAYFGPAAEAVPFLHSLGITSAVMENAADFLVDSVSTLPNRVAALHEEEEGEEDDGRDEGALHPHRGESGAVSSSAHRYASEREKLLPDTHTDAVLGRKTMPSYWKYGIPEPTQGRDIVAAFRAMRLPALHQEMQSRQNTFVEVCPNDNNTDNGHSNTANSRCDVSANNSPYFRSTCTQIHLVARRCFLNRLRDPMTTFVSIMSAMIFAVLVGSMYFQIGNSQASIRNRMGVLFFTVMITTFSSLGSLEVFLKDRIIYTREHRNGVYCASAFFLGKIVQDVPINIVINFAFNAVVYWMVGLQISLYKFFVFDLVCMLLMLNSYAMCLFVSNLAKNFAVANIVASLTLVLFLLPSGGMLVSLDSIPLLWRWIKYISFVRYGFAVLVANEFDGLTFTCDAERSSSTSTPICIDSGTVYAASQGFRIEDNTRYLSLVAESAVLYLLLAFLVLRELRSQRDK